MFLVLSGNVRKEDLNKLENLDEVGVERECGLCDR
jgi:hypothetical protein